MNCKRKHYYSKVYFTTVMLWRIKKSPPPNKQQLQQKKQQQNFVILHIFQTNNKFVNNKVFCFIVIHCTFISLHIRCNVYLCCLFCEICQIVDTYIDFTIAIFFYFAVQCGFWEGTSSNICIPFDSYSGV